MDFFCGVDIGSSTTKTIVIDDSERIVACNISNTGSQFNGRASKSLGTVAAGNGKEEASIRYTVSTGYGRKLFKEADEFVSEITANAVGSLHFVNGNAVVRTIINIGGQDSKIIIMGDGGRVETFSMNDRCAAGTGRFLEMAARKLEIPIEEMGDYHLRSKCLPAVISSTCSVFAESEIISLLAQGNQVEQIVAGIHYSIARRIAALARRTGITESVLFDGGPALNKGLVYALEDELSMKLLLSESPQFTTALGAAMIARSRYCVNN